MTLFAGLTRQENWRDDFMARSYYRAQRCIFITDDVICTTDEAGKELRRPTAELRRSVVYINFTTDDVICRTEEVGEERR